MGETQQTKTHDPASMDQVSAAFRQVWDQGESIVRSLTQWNNEISRFVGERMSHNALAFHRIAGCYRMPEIIDAETQWMREAFDDYAQESRHLMEANRKLLASLVGSATEGAENGAASEGEPGASKSPARMAA